MSFEQLASMFNRAWAFAFNWKKMLMLFLTLIFGGVFFLFFQGISLYLPIWLQIPFKWIPFFPIFGLLMAAGVLVGRSYLEEEEIEFTGHNTLTSLWSSLITASYFAIPLLIAFVACWVLLSLFILVKAIPYLGIFFGIVFSFAPFLLILAVLLLFAFALISLFFITPVAASKEKINWQNFVSGIKRDAFTHLLFLGIAVVPVWIAWFFLKKACLMSLGVYSFGDSQLEVILQSFFVLLPFSALFSPFLIFFFNFAVEAYLFHKS